MLEPTRPSAPRSHLLLADDDRDFRQLTESQLRRAGYLVTALRDGEHIVEHLATSMLLRRLPDAVVSDIRMPGATGIEITRALQSAAPIPVILMTAFGDSETVDEALQAGASAVLSKPFDADSLVRAIERALGRKRPRA